MIETKILKQRVRDHLDPKRDLGHSDTPSKSASKATPIIRSEVAVQVVTAPLVKLNPDGTVCEDCN